MKRLKVLILSVIILGSILGFAYAGSITKDGTAPFVPRTVAKEVVDGGTPTSPISTNVGLKLTTGEFTYIPSDYQMGVLTDPVVNILVSDGKLSVKGGVIPEVCLDTTLVATYLSGSGTSTLIFSGPGKSMANGLKYTVKKNNCNDNLAADDITLTVPPGLSSTTLTAKSGTTTAVHDQASIKFIDVKPEFTASVSLKADAKIGPALGFKKFSRDGTTDIKDDIKIKIEKATLDHPTTTAAGDKTTIKIALTDVSGLKEDSVSIDQGFSCTFSLTTKIATCTKTAAAAGVEPTITFTVDGTTVLAERNFTATAEIDFATAGMKDRTVANDFALLKDADAGKWVFDATKVYVPLIGTNPDTGRETYIKLFSSVNTTVKGIVIASDGSSVVVDLGTIEAGKPKTITGAQLKELVEAQGKTVDGLLGFPAMFSITEAKENIFGYANMIDPSGAKRIPLSIESGVSN